jgi:hypothetical protein
MIKSLTSQTFVKLAMTAAGLAILLGTAHAVPGPCCDDCSQCDTPAAPHPWKLSMCMMTR